MVAADMNTGTQWGRWRWVERWIWPAVHPVRFYKLRRSIKAMPPIEYPDLFDRRLQMYGEIAIREQARNRPFTIMDVT